MYAVSLLEVPSVSESLDLVTWKFDLIFHSSPDPVKCQIFQILSLKYFLQNYLSIIITATPLIHTLIIIHLDYVTTSNITSYPVCFKLMHCLLYNQSNSPKIQILTYHFHA